MPYFIVHTTKNSLSRMSMVGSTGFETYDEAETEARTRYPAGQYEIIEMPDAWTALCESEALAGRRPRPAGGWARYAPVFHLVQDLAQAGYSRAHEPDRHPWTQRIMNAMDGAEDRGPGMGPVVRPRRDYDPAPGLRSVLTELRQDPVTEHLHLHDRIDELLALVETPS
jgi:hypothetical protein